MALKSPPTVAPVARTIQTISKVPLVANAKKPKRRSKWLGLIPRRITREGLVLDQHIREGRFQRSLSLITAFASLVAGLEVTYEHYQGSYSQRIMYSPVLLTPPMVIAGIWGAFNRKIARTFLPIISLITMLDGIVGFIFHIRGIARKPGGWRIPIFNIIMGPPLFAPLLFATSGFLGLITSLLRREGSTNSPLALPKTDWIEWLPGVTKQRGIVLEQDVREGRFQRVLGVATAISAFFSGIESLYSHYKNNFQYKVQWTPILLTPALMIAGFGTLWSRQMAKTLLPITSILALINGGMGFFYHARGIWRRPGGLKKPWYNIMYGPPIFAPLLFAASGFLGVLASLLRRVD